MHVELSTSLVWSFLAVLARVGSLFTFLPLPGLKSPFDPPRILLSVLLTLCLEPRWPVIAPTHTPISSLLLLVVREAALGLGAGLILHFLFEAFQFGAQALSQLAGFSYASTIDPTNDTDSGILLILCQLFCGWLSIAFGLDRQLILLLAGSLETAPPGQVLLSPEGAERILRMGALIFETGLRLALPAIGIFLVFDVLLGVLSRLEQQLQLTTVLFPAKTAGAILVTASLVAVFPQTFYDLSQICLGAVRALLRT
jgi:flagellar biosynthetic protein FliR